MERLISMSKWGKTFIDDSLYAAYLKSRRAYMDSDKEPNPFMDDRGPRISKTVYPDGKTVHHCEARN